MAESKPFSGTETHIPPPARGTSISERNEMSNENKQQCVVVTAIDVQVDGEHVSHPSMTDDDLRQAIRRMEIELLDRKVGLYRGRPKANLCEYVPGGALQPGCTIVILLEDKGWAVDVYAPGYPPVGGQGMLMGCAQRAPGSTGIGIDALIQHGGWRQVLPQMKQAERAYAASLGSGTTE